MVPTGAPKFTLWPLGSTMSLGVVGMSMQLLETIGAME
jgi:hypothetical protein